MVRRSFAPGEIWRRPARRAGRRGLAGDALGTVVALALVPVALLVMAATLAALPLLCRISARKEKS